MSSMWHQRQQNAPLPLHPPPASQTPQHSRVPKDDRKCPSKILHDRKRQFKRDMFFFQRRMERLRLFGYVILRSGEVTSPEDALSRLRDGIRAKERKEKPPANAISQEDILQWHDAEVYRDCVQSIGEVDAVSEFPALDITAGVVLIDPKLRHRDPALRSR
jgi:hypothetical protein